MAKQKKKDEKKQYRKMKAAVARLVRERQARRMRNRQHLLSLARRLTPWFKAHWHVPPCDDLRCVSVHGYYWLAVGKLLKIHLDGYSISLSLHHNGQKVGDECFAFRLYEEALLGPLPDSPTPVERLVAADKLPDSLGPMIGHMHELLAYWAS